MNDKLSPELVVMAISNGMLDEDLSQIIDAAIARREIAATRKAINLDNGDEFLIVNIRPQYLTGERVRFVGFEGNWLRCMILGHPGGRYRNGQILKLRHTHVGAIVKRAHDTNNA